MKLLFFIVIIAMGCTHNPKDGAFNLDRDQDGSCYGKYGGQLGYCDQSGRSR